MVFGISAVVIFSSLDKKAPKSQLQKNTSQTKPFPDKKVHHNNRIEEIYKQLTDLTSTLSYQRVLDTALDLSMQSLSSPDDPADRLVSAVLLFSKEEGSDPDLYIAASRGFTRSDLRDTFPAEGGQGALPRP